jgi:Cu(I)/Ag(I) efflux system membrane fusion protein/cobalt-zinc-cadmium efflux system membrane fusion protein
MKMQQVGLVLALVTAEAVAAYGSKPQASSQSGMHDGMQQSNSQENPSAMPSKIGVALTTDPSPAKKGTNTFRVKLTDQGGQPITGAEVTVTLSMAAMPSMNMPAMKTVVKGADQGGGIYEGKSDLASGGIWQVTITARQNGKTIATKKLTLKASGGM